MKVVDVGVKLKTDSDEDCLNLTSSPLAGCDDSQKLVTDNLN